jgi:transcriptional regulator with XRE-family HTH domain
MSNQIQCDFLQQETILHVEIAFGQILRRLRGEKKISQEKLALMTGLDRTYISLLERGMRQPTLKTMLLLARALGVSSGQLITDVETLLNENYPG